MGRRRGGERAARSALAGIRGGGDNARCDAQIVGPPAPCQYPGGDPGSRPQGKDICHETWSVSRVRIISSSLACLSVLFGYLFLPAAGAEDVSSFRNDVITQVPLGHVDAGNYALRATITTMEPFAKIPPHVHEFGGIRYVLEGAITINWKDGGSQTFAQGSTYFEGPGQNHRPGVMAASNPTDKITRLLHVEWVPVN